MTERCGGYNRARLELYRTAKKTIIGPPVHELHMDAQLIFILVKWVLQPFRGLRSLRQITRNF